MPFARAPLAFVFSRSLSPLLIALMLVSTGPASSVAQDSPLVGDFDGGGVDDLMIYSRDGGYWEAVRPSSGHAVVVERTQWGGQAFDMPVVGDFDGDTRDDLGIYRPDEGRWYLQMRDPQRTIRRVFWGGDANDRPIVGDFDGDGRDDLGIFRLDEGRWYLRSVEGDWRVRRRFAGEGAYRFLVGNVDRDPADELVIYERDTGIWTARNLNGSRAPLGWRLPSEPGDVPLMCDFSGDSRDDLVIYHRSGQWSVRRSRDGRLLYNRAQWGRPGDLPRPGRYHFNTCDFGIYRPVTGEWWLRDPAGTWRRDHIPHGEPYVGPD